MKMNRLTILITAFVIALSVGTAGYVYFDSNQPLQVVDLAETSQGSNSLVGGTYTLVNHRGEQVQHSDFHGRYQLIYFGFTNCSTVCPTNLSEMAEAVDLLGPLGEEVTPIFMTIDPGSDTVEALSDYMPLFSDRMVGLTGSLDQVYEALDNYRVFFKKVVNKDAPEVIDFDHTSLTFLMDRNGRYLAHFKDGETGLRIADTTYRMIRMLEPRRKMPQIKLAQNTGNAS